MQRKTPAYKRQKLALALLEAFGGSLSKTDFQKLLFLYTTMHTDDKPYTFVPYFYGCYSFQAHSDLETMQKYGFLSSDTAIYSKNNTFIGSFLNFLDEHDRNKLKSFAKKFQDLKGKNLIAYVYNHFPYFTIHSQIAKDYLDQATIDSYKPQDKEAQFFTIGYEGKTVELYINELIKNNIHVLIDVRKNAMSMKFGFSKNFLKRTLENMGIQYIHIPELGIESENRQTLNTLDDYKILFKEYEKGTLRNAAVYLDKLFSLYKQYNRVAIMCYEKDIQMCHRGCIAKEIEKKHKITIQHI